MNDESHPPYGETAARALRAEAEARLAAGPPPAADIGLADALKLLHELQVHQVELELQHAELERSRQALELALSRQRLLYDHAPVGYCTVGTATEVIEANAMACTLLRTERSALIGRPLERLLAPDGARALHTLMLRMAEWPSLHVCEAACSDALADDAGHRRTLQVEARPDPGGASVLLALIDITSRKRQEAQQRRAEVAEQTHLAKNAFFSQLSHELRTPLNAILGFAQLLQRHQEKPLGEMQLQWVGQIERSGKHMMALVAEALELARIDAGRIEVHVEAVSVEHVIADAMSMLASSAEFYGVRLAREPAPREGCQALADVRRLNQVLLNLLSNAIKYNRHGGEVRVRLREEPGAVVVDVADTGIGMTPEQMRSLFRPFERLGLERSGIEGTGLGLLIARRLSEAMNAHLTLHSQAGVGTTATLVMPAAA